ncbi:MAG: hypothetical protein P9L94_05920 [Candidatus Hinthialibacter antarcticus]|nr:hypothetical protein [Candidatus Hinthialibacter antarcticus]
MNHSSKAEDASDHSSEPPFNAAPEISALTPDPRLDDDRRGASLDAPAAMVNQCSTHCR